MSEMQNMAALPQPGVEPAGGGGAPAVPSPSPRDPRRSPLARFFGVVARPQSWLNLLYLALAFPLGLFYFVFLTVCLAVGIGLVIIWVGIFILALTAACSWAFAAFERSLADGLLGTRLAPSPQPWRRAQGTLPRIKAHFGSITTWKDLAFLFVKFPLGVLSFCVVVTLAASSVALLGAPFYYRYAESSGAHGMVHHGIYFGVWTVDRLWEALLLVPLGLLLAVVSFHAFNGLAAMWRAVARGFLEPGTTPRPVPVVAAAGPPAPPPSPPQAPPPSQPGQPAATPQGSPAQPAAGWPAYPGYPELPGVTPSPHEPPAPNAAPGGPPPYGWPYYPQSPYPQSPYPPQSTPQSTPQPGAPQPGAAQPGAPWSGAAWPGGPWAGAPWPQWPSMFPPPPAPAPADGPPDPGTAASPETPAPTPDTAAPTPETAAPETTIPETTTDGEPPSQEEKP